MNAAKQERKNNATRPAADDSEIRYAGRGELSVVYAVLRQYLKRSQRHECWRKWGPILEKEPLFVRTPFKNVLAFSNQLAAEHGLDRVTRTRLRRDLFRKLAEYHSDGRLRSHMVTDQLYPVRFLVPGMKGFASGSMRRTAANTFELITDRGIIVGNPVQVLAKKQAEDDRVVQLKGYITQVVSDGDLRRDEVPQAYRFRVDRVSTMQ